MALKTVSDNFRAYAIVGEPTSLQRYLRANKKELGDLNKIYVDNYSLIFLFSFVFPSIECARVLLKNGVKIDSMLMSINPLTYALENKIIDFVRLFLEEGNYSNTILQHYYSIYKNKDWEYEYLRLIIEYM